MSRLDTVAARLRILIVDDDEDMAWALRTIIQQEGHSPVVTRSAAEALCAIVAESLHLALVDAKLPDMEGLDLAGRINQLSPKLPCVIVSGYFYGEEEPVQAAMASGSIRGFIGKPFQLDQIREIIRATVS